MIEFALHCALQYTRWGHRPGISVLLSVNLRSFVREQMEKCKKFCVHRSVDAAPAQLIVIGPDRGPHRNAGSVATERITRSDHVAERAVLREENDPSGFTVWGERRGADQVADVVEKAYRGEDLQNFERK